MLGILGVKNGGQSQESVQVDIVHITTSGMGGGLMWL